MPPVNGNIVSEPHNPLFLLDESLVPAVARALNAVGYRFITVLDALGARTGDPEIIDWCRERDAVWVHADDRARKEHRALLQRSGIRTVWVYRPHGQMTGREQLRICPSYCPNCLNAGGNIREFGTTAHPPPTRCPSRSCAKCTSELTRRLRQCDHGPGCGRQYQAWRPGGYYSPTSSYASALMRLASSEMMSSTRSSVRSSFFQPKAI